MKDHSEPRGLDRELRRLLRELEDWLETPMVVLAFVWLVLMIVEFIWGLVPLLEVTITVISSACFLPSTASASWDISQLRSPPISWASMPKTSARRWQVPGPLRSCRRTSGRSERSLKHVQGTRGAKSSENRKDFTACVALNVQSPEIGGHASVSGRVLFRSLCPSARWYRLVSGCGST